MFHTRYTNRAAGPAASGRVTITQPPEPGPGLVDLIRVALHLGGCKLCEELRHLRAHLCHCDGAPGEDTAGCARVRSRLLSAGGAQRRCAAGYHGSSHRDTGAAISARSLDCSDRASFQLW